MACAAPLAQTPPSIRPTTTEAQTEQILKPGTRIRATVGAGRRYGLVGRVLEVRGDKIIVQPDDAGEPRHVLKPRFTGLQVSQATSSYGPQGLLIGGIAGSVVGYVTGHRAGDDKVDPDAFYLFGMTRQEKATLGAWVGGALGAAVGLAVGWAIDTDRWETMPLQNLGIVAPSGQGEGWGVRLSFSR